MALEQASKVVGEEIKRIRDEINRLETALAHLDGKLRPPTRRSKSTGAASTRQRKPPRNTRKRRATG